MAIHAAIPAGVSLRRPQPFLSPAGSARQARRGLRTTCQAAQPQPPEQEQQQQQQPPLASQDASTSGSVRDALRAAEQGGGQKKRRQADSTDWFATQLTRRFGLAGGLAWTGFLAVGVLGEQIKTRIELASEEANTKDVSDAAEVVTPQGLRFRDLKLGGGSPPIKGYIMVVDYKLSVDGQVVEDTSARGKPIVFLYGKRPFSGGMCLGVEQAMATMRAGGRRRIVVPPELGFGDNGLTLRPTEHVPEKRGEVPPGSTLEYDLTLVRVSIPPS